MKGYRLKEIEFLPIHMLPTIHKYSHSSIAHIFYKILFLFLERGEGKEKKGEKHQGVVASCAPNQGPGPQPRYLP